MRTQFRKTLRTFARIPATSGVRESPAARSADAKTKVSVNGTFPARSQPR
jgi:hypothetical protein